MTVKELIAKLQERPEDFQVYVNFEGSIGIIEDFDTPEGDEAVVLLCHDYDK